MTDEQIIKALEHNASKCKFYEDGRDGGLFESTLDLINRQKAENEKITEKYNCQQTVYADLSKIIKEQAEELKQAKSEAIKEFAEQLKGYAIGENGSKEKAYFFVEVQDIDNLVKEVTEVNENEMPDMWK